MKLLGLANIQEVGQSEAPEAPQLQNTGFQA